MGVIGFIRKIGDSGQIALPKELMEIHGWQGGMLVEIFFSDTEMDRIILKKYRPGENLFGERTTEIIIDCSFGEGNASVEIDKDRRAE